MCHNYYWHTVYCDVPPVNNEITLTLNSTLEGSQLLFWCDESPNETMIASCLSDGRWSVDTGQYSCTTKGKPCTFSAKVAVRTNAGLIYNRVVIFKISKYYDVNLLGVMTIML